MMAAMTVPAIRKRLLLAAVVSMAAGLSALPASSRAADDAEARPPSSAAASSAAGTFLPWTMSARTDRQRGFLTLGGGYDSARQAGLATASAETQLWGPLSLRLGGFYSEAARTLRPDVGVKLGALRQEAHGLDGAVSLSYRAEGFNLKPALEALAAVGRQVGRTTLVANLAFGQGLEEGERYGDVRLAALHRIGRAVHAGLDARARADLELDFPEPAGEPELELQAGPVLTVPIGRVAVTAYGGLSVVRFREGEESLVGATGGLNVGSVF
jgi:hypothetical protein